MSKKTEKILKEIVERLKAYKPEKIILFGSAASGEKRIGDLDLFIIKKTNEPRTKRYDEVNRLLLDRDLPLDLLVYTPEEVDYCLKIKDFFIEDILSKGKILYESLKITNKQ